MSDALTANEKELVDLRQKIADMETLERRCAEIEAALQSRQRRDHLLGQSAPLGIVVIDRDGTIQGLSRKVLDWLPWPRDLNPEGMNLFEFQPLVDAGVIEDFKHCITKNRTIQQDYPCVDNENQCLQLRFHLGPVADQDGTVTGVMAFVENTTQLKEARDAARESEQRYHLLFQSAPIAMLERDASQLKAHLNHLRATGIVDLKSHFEHAPGEVLRCVSMIKTTDCNDAFLELFETRDKLRLLQAFPQVAMGPEFQRMAREMVLLADEGCTIPEKEMTIQTMQGRSKRVMMRAMALAGHETTMARVVLSMVDISARVAAEEALRASEQRFREQALQDNLTGLHNQRYLYHSLPLLIQSARTEKNPLSIIFMDLDNFKSVVDTHGHLNGSRVIQEVAVVLGKTISTPAYAVAYAGDEFVVVLPDAAMDQARQIASQILENIINTSFLHSQNRNVRLTASFGIATFPEHGEDAEALLAAADAALFVIKKTGKGTIGIARGSRNAGAQRSSFTQ